MKNLIKILISVAALLLLYSCGKNNQITLQGYIDATYTYVSSGVSGKLLTLYVNKGDHIQENQLLFKLDPEPETSQLEQAKNKLSQSEQVLSDLQKGQRDTVISGLLAARLQVMANLDFARKTLDRYQALYKSGVLDKNSLDKATSDFNEADQKMKESEAHIEEARLGARENLIKAQQAVVASNMAEVKATSWSVSQKTIYSPINARVFDNLYEVGEFVEPGSPVYVLLPRTKIKVIFFVPESYLSYMKAGKIISFSCDSCKQKYPVAISFISPAAEYTPPVIFSKDSRDKLVYRIEALLSPEISDQFNVGQPVDVYITLK
jgi:HlyD family secretion protein